MGNLVALRQYLASRTGEPMSIEIENVSERPVAAIRRRMRQPEIATGFRLPLDEVWRFMRKHAELCPDHNVFIYHPAAECAGAMDIDFGVEVAQPFPAEGEVRCVTMPAGRAATMLHVGPYDRLVETHTEVQRWCAANGHPLAGVSWEIYGHWNDDPSKLETRVGYLLR
jgi:effector-binding domain-containing protein